MSAQFRCLHQYAAQRIIRCVCLCVCVNWPRSSSTDGLICIDPQPWSKRAGQGPSKNRRPYITSQHTQGQSTCLPAECRTHTDRITARNVPVTNNDLQWCLSNFTRDASFGHSSSASPEHHESSLLCNSLFLYLSQGSKGFFVIVLVVVVARELSMPRSQFEVNVGLGPYDPNTKSWYFPTFSR